MSECSNCALWKMFDDYPTMGTCKRSGGCTSAGFWCQAHQPKAAKSQAEPRTREPLDIKAAAEKVLAANGYRVDIASVQRIVRCGYGDAAKVIEYLKENGRIG